MDSYCFHSTQKPRAYKDPVFIFSVKSHLECQQHILKMCCSNELGGPCKLVISERNHNRKRKKKKLGKVLLVKSDFTTCGSSYLKECQENFEGKNSFFFRKWNKKNKCLILLYQSGICMIVEVFYFYSFNMLFT